MRLDPEWKDRLWFWNESLIRDFYHPLGKIEFEGFLTFDQLSREEALCHSFEKIAEGTVWGEEWQYAWMKSRIVLPEEAKDKLIVMDLNPGGEALIYLDDKVYGSRRADWIKIPYHSIVDNYLCENGVPGQSYSLLLEVYAGNYYPMGPIGGIGPVLPGMGMYEAPEEGKKQTETGISTYGVWNEEAYQLWLDVTVLTQIMDVLPDTSLRAQKILKGLKDFTLAVDFEQPYEERVKDYQRGRAILNPLMEANNGSSMPSFYAVGHSHLDVAWLWPIRETIHKTGRMFSQQLRQMEKYPDYVFVQDMPYLYEMCKEHFPELYERIKEAVKEGRWVAEGSMWLEPDSNMSGGESLIRQMLYGLRFYREEFGVDCKLLWLPDTFGYTAALPQIIKGFGIPYLMAQKVFESYNSHARFPYHYLKWEGMDGSQVTTFMPTSYSYRMTPEHNIQTWDERSQKDELDRFLIPFGYGDGGCGPTRDHLELALRQKDLEGAPKVRMESPVCFFEELEREGGPVHKYSGELYLTMYRGMYTVQGMIKDRNRRSEFAVREAEMFEAIRFWKNGDFYPYEKMERVWKDLLLNQFHDILCGTCIERVNEEALELYEQILSNTKKMSVNSLKELAGESLAEGSISISISNTLSWMRSLVAELPEAFKKGAKTAQGEAVPVETIGGRVYGYVTLPSCGYEVFVPCDAVEETKAAVRVYQKEQCWILENEKVMACINRSGEVISFIRKETGREFAKAPMNHFRLYKDVPRVFDAWEIEPMYEEQEIPLLDTADIQIGTEGKLKCSVIVKKKIGNSELSQEIVLDAASERLDFVTKVLWHELHRLLKVSFPVAVYTDEAINEIQFGYIKRPTHRNTKFEKDRFEVCSHRYTALADESHGAAVLNNNKYGVSMLDNSIDLTLLRAEASPVMRGDNGEQRFTYSFTAWDGSFLDSPVVRRGYELNEGVLTIPGGKRSESWFTIDKENIIIESIKAAEDKNGDLVLRLYEAKKADTKADLFVSLPCQEAWLCNMNEEPLEEVPIDRKSKNDSVMSIHFGPFEIRTIRIKRI